MSVFKKFFESNDLDVNHIIEEDSQLDEYGYGYGGIPRNSAKDNFKRNELEFELRDEDPTYYNKRRNYKPGPSEGQIKFLRSLGYKGDPLALTRSQASIEIDKLKSKTPEFPEVEGASEEAKRFAANIARKKGQEVTPELIKWAQDKLDARKNESENKMRSWKENFFESNDSLEMGIFESILREGEMEDEDEDETEITVDAGDKEVSVEAGGDEVEVEVEPKDQTDEKMDESDLSPEQEREMDVDDDGDIDANDLKHLRKNK